MSSKLFLIILFCLSVILVAQTQAAPVAVTVAEYCGFLNAVAKTDTYSLYNPKMGSDANVASIDRLGTPGHYKYKVINDKLGNGASPITYVTQFAAARFCNWMENNIAVGDQGISTTETGTYDLTSIDQGTSDLLPLSTVGATYFLPNDYLFDTRSSSSDGENCAPSTACNFIGFRIATLYSDANTASSSSSLERGTASAASHNNFSHIGFVGGFLGQDIVPPAPPKSGGAMSSSSSKGYSNAAPINAASTNLVNIALIPVNYAGNNADTSNVTAGSNRFGAVPFNYQIGTFDVTAEQYCAFLNAVAKTDPHALYDTNMASDSNVACITRSTDTNNNYVYALTSSNVAKLPITYVSWFAATRFCNWLENGEPVGDEGPGTTESGAFNSGIAVPGAKWSLPTEDQWYKAAYYVPPSTNYPSGTYDIFGTGANTAPGNKWEDAVVANTANYSLNGLPTTSAAPRLTPVGAFTNSGSPCGAYDMAGNVDQWTDTFDVTGNNVIIRGGSWNSQTSDDLSSSSRRTNPGLGNATTGFRVVYNVPVPVTISKITIDLVPVGDPGNTADVAAYAGAPTFGAVQTSYQIGTYDVTASQYCMFLNAVAATDDFHNLYNTNMASDPNVASIIRSGANNNYVYSVIPGREKLPVTYVRWFAAIRFCNWLENGQPIGEESTNTTESGSFNTDTNGVFSLTTNAIWALPTEDQWYKAAYYIPLSSTNFSGQYYSFGTANQTAPGNQLLDAALPDRANYDLGGTTGANNYTTPGLPRLTPVGTFIKSASSWGAYDMSGNVDQWTLGIAADEKSLVVRGGSWASTNSTDLSYQGVQFISPMQATNTLGFRVVYNVEPPPPSAPSFITLTKQNVKKVISAVRHDCDWAPKIFSNEATRNDWLNHFWGYLMGAGLGEMGYRLPNGLWSLPHTVVTWFRPAMARDTADAPGWGRIVYNALFAPARTANYGRVRLAARGARANEFDAMAYRFIAKQKLDTAQKKLTDALRANEEHMGTRMRQVRPDEDGYNPDEETWTADETAAGTTPTGSSTAVTQANEAVTQASSEYETALTVAGEAVEATEGADLAVAAEVGAAALFASPVAAIVIPVAVIAGGITMIVTSVDPRFGVGLLADGVVRSVYYAVKILGWL